MMTCFFSLSVLCLCSHDSWIVHADHAGEDSTSSVVEVLAKGIDVASPGTASQTDIGSTATQSSPPVT